MTGVQTCALPISSSSAGRTRVNIESRFEIMRTAVSGSMSKFFMARDRESDDVVGLKVANPKKTKLFESRFKVLKKPTEGADRKSVV